MTDNGNMPRNPFTIPDDEVDDHHNKHYSSSIDEMKKQKAWGEILDPSVSTGINTDDIKIVDHKGRKRKIIILTVVLLIAIVLMTVGWLILSFMRNTNTKYDKLLAENSMTAPTPEHKDVLKEKNTNGQYNPAAKSKDVGEPVNGDINVTADNNALVVKTAAGEHRVQFSALTDKINPTSKPCTLKEQASNCYVGQSKIGDKVIRFYSTRDAKTNALLTGQSDPQIVQKNGAAVAFIRNYQVDGKSSSGLTVVFPDQTAVIAVSDDQSAMTSLAAGDSHFQATSTQ